MCAKKDEYDLLPFSPSKKKLRMVHSLKYRHGKNVGKREDPSLVRFLPIFRVVLNNFREDVWQSPLPKRVV